MHVRADVVHDHAYEAPAELVAGVTTYLCLHKPLVDETLYHAYQCVHGSRGCRVVVTDVSSILL